MGRARKRDAQRTGNDDLRSTHSVPFQVLKYRTIWSRLGAPEAANPANVLFFLLVMVSEFTVGWSLLKSRVKGDVRLIPELPCRRRVKRVICLHNQIKAHSNRGRILFFSSEQSWGHQSSDLVQIFKTSRPRSSPLERCVFLFENLRGLCLRLLESELLRITD